MMNSVDIFRQAILKAGLVPPSSLPLGKVTRFPGVGKSNGNKSGWAWLSEDGLGGAFGDWASGLSETWAAHHDQVMTTAAERAAHAKRVAELRRIRQEEEARQHAEVAQQAQAIWDHAAPAPADHPYLLRKSIRPHSLRLDADNRLIAPVTIDGEITSLQLIDEDGNKKFLPGGAIKVGIFTIGDLSEAGTLLLCEGFATGASLHEATGYPVAVAFSAHNLRPVAEQLREQCPTATIVVCGDNDIRSDETPNTGLEAATFAANAVRGVLVMPELDGRKCDWNDVHTQRGLDAVQAAITTAIRREETPPPAPVTVIPLDEVRLPDLTLDTFPEPLGRMIEAVANATETPVELPALMGLATVAASCQRVFEVEMEPGYLEPLCVWAIAALQSGNRKTAVHSAMTAPLKKKERALCDVAKTKRMEVESERATLEARVKSLRSRLANSEDFEHSEKVQREITQLETTMPTVPSMPSLWAQDVTPEKLGVMMADNGERLAILSDEGGFFDIITGRYSNGIPNLDTCLQAHSCSAVKVNRGGRDEVYMQRPTLTIGLSPQPSVLRDLSNKSLLRDRGFLARVLFALPTSRLGFRTLHCQPISPAIETAYHRTVDALLAFQPPTTEEGHEAAYHLKPSPEAHREWKEFALTVERDMRPGEQYEHMTDWAGKLPGAAVRVAGLFHCVQHAHAQPHGIPICLDTMQRALGVLAVLSQHALAVFDLMGADPALDGARRVWRWVEQGKRQTFTARECFQDLRGRFHRMADLDQSFSVLCERGYLFPGADNKSGPGRPTRPYTVNPTLTKGWL